MAKNDVVILDGVIDDRILQKIPSDKRDEAFEFLSIEQILKDLNPSSDEIMQGIVDGQNDGGIDAFYIFVNGHCIDDHENFNWPKANIDIQVFIITCKHHDTFKQAPLDNLVATLSELLDFSIPNEVLKGDYNEAVLEKRNLLKSTYRKCASKISNMLFSFCYASRGETSQIGESVRSRATQIEMLTQASFGNCKAKFIFYGGTELVDLYRKKPNFSLELPFVEYFGRGERYVLLARLTDYFQFISDDEQKLRRYLFDSNVRDFMGLKGVNQDIRETLNDVDSADFWWLNNGVTILATSARVIGKSIQIEDIQIVNGLQTTESIFNHFNNGKNDPHDRSVLVKVLVSKDANVRDSIIRATNNQTAVEIPALHATDKIQRDIEDILLKHNFYYERRTRYYSNLSIHPSLIITPLYIAAAYLNLIKRQPSNATRLKSKFMRNDVAYEAVFSEKVNINIWPQIIMLTKKTDEFLESQRSNKNGSEGFLKRWRQIISMLVISKKLGKFNYGETEFLALDVSTITFDDYELIWFFVKSLYKVDTNSKNKSSFVRPLCINATLAFGITGIEIFSFAENNIPISLINTNLTNEFVDKVNSLLPAQPWNKKTFALVAETVGVTAKEVQQASVILIKEGRRFYQKNNLLFDRVNNRFISMEE